MNIDYNLIGSIPALECFRHSLPKLIDDFRKCDKCDKDSKVTLGVTIELCAQHFYGIDTVALNSFSETIAAIEAAEQELQLGK